MSLAEEVADLQARLEAARRDRARAVAAHDLAKATAEKQHAELLAEFGVTSVEEADELLVKLRTNVVRTQAQINDILTRIGV